MKDFESNIRNKITDNSTVGAFTSTPSEVPDLPKVQKLAREIKSKTLTVSIKPSTYKGLQKIAENENISRNEAINQILDIYMKTNGII